MHLLIFTTICLTTNIPFAGNSKRFGTAYNDWIIERRFYSSPEEHGAICNVSDRRRDSTSAATSSPAHLLCQGNLACTDVREIRAFSSCVTACRFSDEEQRHNIERLLIVKVGRCHDMVDGLKHRLSTVLDEIGPRMLHYVKIHSIGS